MGSSIYLKNFILNLTFYSYEIQIQNDHTTLRTFIELIPLFVALSKPSNHFPSLRIVRMLRRRCLIIQQQLIFVDAILMGKKHT